MKSHPVVRSIASPGRSPYLFASSPTLGGENTSQTSTERSFSTSSVWPTLAGAAPELELALPSASGEGPEPEPAPSASGRSSNNPPSHHHHPHLSPLLWLREERPSRPWVPRRRPQAPRLFSPGASSTYQGWPIEWPLPCVFGMPWCVEPGHWTGFLFRSRYPATLGSRR